VLHLLNYILYLAYLHVDYFILVFNSCDNRDRFTQGGWGDAPRLEGFRACSFHDKAKKYETK
jgi:hypothetical protein